MDKATEMTARQVSLGSQVKPFIKTMRPKQWTKNVFVWGALFFDQKLFVPRYFIDTLITFVLFCMVSSVVYIINDLVDIERDRLHPTKATRPLASGALSPRVAFIGATILLLITIPGALWVNPWLAPLLYGYLLLMVAYSFWLKHI